MSVITKLLAIDRLHLLPVFEPNVAASSHAAGICNNAEDEDDNDSQELEHRQVELNLIGRSV